MTLWDRAIWHHMSFLVVKLLTRQVVLGRCFILTAEPGVTLQRLFSCGGLGVVAWHGCTVCMVATVVAQVIIPGQLCACLGPSKVWP
jgi:hypothetical protein